MRRFNDDAILVALTLVLVAVTLSDACSVPAQAQGNRRESAALLLARICVSEAGWYCWDTGDGLAIHEVLLRGAEREGMRYESFARTYARRATGTVPTTSPRTAWVAGLWDDGRPPTAWPVSTFVRQRDGSARVVPHPPWAAYRARWLGILARAREVVGLSLATSGEWSVCGAPVHDWGGAMDRERATRIGLIEVECGQTANDFYARPSQMRVE
jgi:hypothetical protein